MFGRTRGTIIGQGLKVVGKVTAEGLVEVYGEIDGEVQCASLFLARKARVNGAITAAKVIVDGRVEGPIDAADVVLSREPMSWEIFVTDLLRSGKAPISRDALCKPIVKTGASRTKLARSNFD